MKWRYFSVALSLTLFAATLALLHHILADVSLAAVLASFRETPARSIALATLCTVGSYITLTGYDVIALRYLGRPLSYARAALASFTSYAFSHNIGFSPITDGSIRYRIYSTAGLSVTEVAQLTAICALTFVLGAGCLLGLALALEPAALPLIDALPLALTRGFGVAILVALAAYAVWTGMHQRPLRLRHWNLRPPSLAMTLGQLALGIVDVGFAAAALYLLLPADVGVGFIGFVGIYVTAMTLAIMSYAPGGLGVFEATMLVMLPDSDQAALVGALLVYRCLYYLLPLAVAAGLLAWHEYSLDRRAITGPAGTIRDLTRAAAPSVIGAAVFVGGGVLLFSAATPALEARMQVLRQVLPLPFVEASHLLSSVAGLCLMILARGLFRRLDTAYWLTVFVLCAGIVFSLLKGLDYEEALILSVVLVLLVATRGAFYREASLFSQPFSAAWLATIVAVVAASIWLGMFTFKHVEYSPLLWWQFAYDGNASRFLRASVTVAVLAVCFGALRVVRPALPQTTLHEPRLDTIKAIVARSPRTTANLALMGDKRIVLSAHADAFIMYQIQGRSWIALGDPVGSESSWQDLLWGFRELCDRHRGRPVFFEIGAGKLPVYLDMGLSPFKLGEEALIDLEAFSLEGSTRKGLRHAAQRAKKEGAIFEIIPRADVPALLRELRLVSDEWLKQKSTHEKGFSVGAFKDDYLCNFDCAVIRNSRRIVAFANLWKAPTHELSVDLMRHRADMPHGAMDFLFIQLMLWGKGEGYKWFNLGMAPLSGLQTHPLAPVWNRMGTLIFRHGEHFYNFEGLRAYKEKFHPVWVPRYLAVAGGLSLPRALLDSASLISGGYKNILRR
jgi:phosphatidylglycerol lysyltransferase